jgi:hypothetical protein
MNLMALASAHEAATVQCSTTLSGQVTNCLSLPHNTSIFFGVFGAVFLVAFIFGLICEVKIVSKAGYSGWWVLTAFVPILNFVMFLIFAFGKWPIQTRLETAERRGSRDYVPPQFAPAGAGPTVAPAAAVAPPRAAPGPADEQRTIFCSWCGKARTVDAAAIHHCGSKDRPAVYCMNCGTPFEAGAAECASCGTSVNQVSR